MNNSPLPVLLLWHLHQPLYRPPGEKDFILPWVRLHTLREYHDMAEMIERNPETPVTVNWTPVLLQQIEEYTEGARDRMQKLRDMNAGDLDPAQQYQLVRGAYRAHAPTMIEPYPRFNHLHQKWQEARENADLNQEINWPNDEIRDIQLWSTLTWFGFSAVDNHPEIKKLRDKGENYTEEDKKKVEKIETELLENCIPRWQNLMENTYLELSISPYYHPIGPLLCQYSDIEEAMPNVPKPERKIQWTDDARWHLDKARQAASRWFDLDQIGLWPSEGSLSEDFIKLVEEAGFKWAATDEALLRRRLHEEKKKESEADVYRAYSWQNKLPVFFRDHEISDRIGFDYSKLSPEEAVDDFFGYLHKIKDITPTEKSGRILPVILDGENPWEYFRDAGENFLSNLYGRLKNDQAVKPVTPTHFLKKQQELPRLEKMAAGSWINGDFNIWGGSSLDVRAWDMLAETREALKSWENMDQKCRDKCWEALHIAQGSDWFWWYGEPFHSEDDEYFDEIFRKCLIHVYKQGEHPEPSYLHHPLQSSDSQGYEPPRSFITPEIDGRESHYREWWGAAKVIPRLESGSMARSGERFRTIRLGSNENKLFGRIDFEKSPPRNTICRLKINDSTFVVGPLAENQGTIFLIDNSQKIEGSNWAYERTLEWSLPAEVADIKSGDYCQFQIQLVHNETIFERFPVHDALVIPILDKKTAASEWNV
ncbi:MAG: hypothetical protein ACQEP7_00345 [bacterium]